MRYSQMGRTNATSFRSHRSTMFSANIITCSHPAVVTRCDRWSTWLPDIAAFLLVSVTKWLPTYLFLWGIVFSGVVNKVLLDVPCIFSHDFHFQARVTWVYCHMFGITLFPLVNTSGWSEQGQRVKLSIYNLDHKVRWSANIMISLYWLYTYCASHNDSWA